MPTVERNEDISQQVHKQWVPDLPRAVVAGWGVCAGRVRVSGADAARREEDSSEPHGRGLLPRLPRPFLSPLPPCPNLSFDPVLIRTSSDDATLEFPYLPHLPYFPPASLSPMPPQNPQRYFGGDLQMISMEGYGTDVYLHLNRLGNDEEPLPGAV